MIIKEQSYSCWKVSSEYSSRNEDNINFACKRTQLHVAADGSEYALTGTDGQSYVWFAKRDFRRRAVSIERQWKQFKSTF